MRVLETKLSVPLLREPRVSRPLLTGRLNGSFDRKITLVSAPAGYGKTTILCDWLSELDHSPPAGTAAPAAAWVSMDSDDQDTSRFFEHLHASIARALPDLPCFSSKEERAKLSEAGGLRVPRELINCLVSSDRTLVVVLDDYHCGETTELNEWLADLVGQAPGNMHIVVSTRQDPGMPLGRLRANNSLAEIRAADLRFSAEEMNIFLAEVYNLKLTTQQVSSLEKRLEGWAAGINLAGLMMNDQGDVGEQIESISGAHSYIADYLIEEVLARQPENLRKFLIATSCLKRFNASLCDTVLNQDFSSDLLIRMSRSNSFLISLDRQESWYRYHHLFSNLLHQRFLKLEEHRQRDIHLAAARWFEENGFLSEAIDHTLVGGDMEKFSRLILHFVDRVLLGVGDFRSVERWMNTIPADRILNQSRLAVVWAWTLFYSMRISEVMPVLDRIEQMGEKDDSILAEANAIRATLAASAGDIPEAIALYRSAYRRSESNNDSVRGISALGIGYSDMIKGETKDAIVYLQESVDLSARAGNFSVALKASTYLGLLHIEMGELRVAAAALEDTLKSAIKWETPEASILCMTYAAMADLAREQDRLDDAGSLLNRACTVSNGTGSAQTWYVQIVKSLTRLSGGDQAGAVNLIESLLEDESGPIQMPAIRRTTEACLIRSRIGTDSQTKTQQLISEVESWLSELPDTFDQPTMASLSVLPGHGCEFVPLVKARALIWLERYKPALNLLCPLYDISAKAGRNRSVIENRILQAIASSALGDESGAGACISDALNTSRGEDFIRIFADEGPPAAGLLYTLIRNDNTCSGKINRLLSAFNRDIRDELQEPEVSNANTGLLEPLSDRELDVLRLMAVGHSNREIGDHLFISPQTVKAHSRNIYGKLETHSRTETVSKARMLGLLPGF